jgi:hypothetical protein
MVLERDFYERLLGGISDRLTFDRGESRINGRPVVLKPVSWDFTGRTG